MAKLFIEDLNVSGKKVLVRVDFNVPLDENQKITNDKRIVASIPTIKYLTENGARVILMSHLGRPKGEKKSEFSLAPVAEALPNYVDAKVSFASDCIGDEVEAQVAALSDGEILLLENLRFYKEETDNDAAFAEKLAGLADLYVNDAFGAAHRAHASTAGVTKYFTQNACGYLLKKEMDFLGAAVDSPVKPFVAIIGGAKISGKIDVIRNLIGKVDTLIVGGGMSYTFYRAMGHSIGLSIFEEDRIELAKQLMEEAPKKGTELLLPIDNIVADDYSNDANFKTVDRDEIPEGFEGLDIGPKSRDLFCNAVRNAKTVIWNGPMGVFEFDNFAHGTNAVAQALVEATENGGTTIIGGGDSASAIAKAGLSDKVSHVSTGGGASLEYLEGKILPGLDSLSDK